MSRRWWKGFRKNFRRKEDSESLEQADDVSIPTKQVADMSVGASSEGSVKKLDICCESGIKTIEMQEHSTSAFEVEDSGDFETIYDLDKGREIKRFDLEESPDPLPWRAKVESAKEFFRSEILYKYDILSSFGREALFGKYRVELRGYNGGIWTLNLQNSLEIINRREEAESVISMKQFHFLQIVNGELNPQLAILAKKVRISGNLKKAIVFQGFLAPARD